jgi:hypothetical protein
MKKYYPYPSDKPEKKFCIITNDNKKVYFVGGETDSADYPEKGSIGESIVDLLEMQKNDHTAQSPYRRLLTLVLPLVSRASDPPRECQVGAFDATPNKLTFVIGICGTIDEHL